MKTLALVAIAAVLAGCTAQPSEVQQNVRATPGLEDCTYAEVSRGAGHVIHVIRCPYSATSTTVRAGKQTLRSAVIEDPAVIRERALSKLTPEERQALELK